MSADGKQTKKILRKAKDVERTRTVAFLVSEDNLPARNVSVVVREDNVPARKVSVLVSEEKVPSRWVRVYRGDITIATNTPPLRSRRRVKNF